MKKVAAVKCEKCETYPTSCHLAISESVKTVICPYGYRWYSTYMVERKCFFCGNHIDTNRITRLAGLENAGPVRKSVKSLREWREEVEKSLDV